MVVKIRNNKNSQTDGNVNWFNQSGKLFSSKADHTHTRHLSDPVARSVANRNGYRTSLVVQWLGVNLPIQGTQVPFLVQGDPTGQRATKPTCRNY